MEPGDRPGARRRGPGTFTVRAAIQGVVRPPISGKRA